MQRARIELVGRREGVRRADVQAGPAGAAMVLLRRVGRQGQVGQDDAQEQPGAERRGKPGWCACPASRAPAASASGFSIRGAVSTNTFTSQPACGLERAGQRLQPSLDQRVIVVALGVDRDRRPVAALQRWPAGPHRDRSSGRARSPSGPPATSRVGWPAARPSSPSSPSRRAGPARRIPPAARPRARPVDARRSRRRRNRGRSPRRGSRLRSAQKSRSS